MIKLILTFTHSYANHYKEKKCIFVTDKEERSTVPHGTFSSLDKYVHQSNHFELKSTTTIPYINESKDGDSLANSIKTIWQLILIILAILVIFACAYVVKCVRRQWMSRTLQVTHTNTVTLNAILNENHHTIGLYDQIQDVEHDGSERYLSPACDDTRIAGTCPDEETGVDKVDPVSIAVTYGSSNDEIPIEENVSEENDMHESSVVKGYDDLYITPCM